MNIGNIFPTVSILKKERLYSIMRIWIKEILDNRLVKDMVVTDNSDDTRTHKVFQALDEACHAFDLGKPIWLDSNITDFQVHAKTRFTKDSFIEEIPFDYLEFQVIEED